MFYTYVLKSLICRKFYTGHTENLDRRLEEHNNGYTIYSKRYKPWQLVYYEQFDSKEEAVKREKYFKSAAGRRWLKKYINK
ncbi:MAG: GIY-YIG nuclease family protein [Candidatus Parcubacteria bacterium]|nr:GIY-YIG nuclease family protein [Candidatus Parcubacteria bacterium]